MVSTVLKEFDAFLLGDHILIAKVNIFQKFYSNNIYMAFYKSITTKVILFI